MEQETPSSSTTTTKKTEEAPEQLKLQLPLKRAFNSDDARQIHKMGRKWDRKK
jgi:hypothetical protein